jgi:uncharacterized protein (TIGR00251 family)
MFQAEDRAVVRIKVLPRSSVNQIVGREEGVFKIKLTAPPLEGKANKALKKLLAKRLGLSKKDVEIISGERSRIKSILIHGLSPKKVDALLQR